MVGDEAGTGAMASHTSDAHARQYRHRRRVELLRADHGFDVQENAFGLKLARK
jgi:hypothetical protein